MKRISAFLLRTLLRLFAALPLKVHYFNARWMAWLIGTLAGYRRDVVTINLSRAFPEKKYEELTALRKEFYRCFAELIVEIVWLGGCRIERLRASGIAEVLNPEEADRLYACAPGVMMMTAHIGNWELLFRLEAFRKGEAGALARRNLVAVYKRLSSAAWDEVIRRNRTAPIRDGEPFEHYIESGSALRYVLEHRQDKQFYIFTTDQSPYNDQEAGMGISFMGQQTKTMTGAARLAHKFGLAVTYMEIIRVRQGHYTLRFRTLCDDASKMSIEEIMQGYYRLLEENIRQSPGSYLWSHRRWKTH